MDKNAGERFIDMIPFLILVFILSYIAGQLDKIIKLLQH